MADKVLSVILSGKDELSVKLGAVRKRMDEISTSGKPLRRQLRELQQVMADMNLNGLAGNDTFTELARQAGAYRDAISDATAATNAFADDNFSISAMSEAFAGLSGAISIASGAASMLGVNQESLDSVLRKVQGSIALVNGAQAIANALNKDSALMQKIKQIRLLATAAAQRAAAVSTAASATATGVETAAVTASTAAHTAWNVAVAVGKALFGDMSGLVLLAAVGVGVFAAATADATKEQEKQNETTQKQKSTFQSYKESLASNAGELMGKFAQLRAEWKTLRTEGEKTAWLKKNADFLRSVGVETDNLVAAEKVFNGNTANVVNAIMLRAKAMAAQQMIMEAYKKYMERMQALDSIAGGKYYQPKTYQGPMSYSDDTDWRKKGLIPGVDYRFMRETDGSTYYTLLKSGVSKLTEQLNATAAAAANARYESGSAQALAALNKALDAGSKNIQDAAAELSKMGISLYGGSGSGGARSVGARSGGSSGGARRQQEKPEEGSVKYYEQLIEAEKKYRETHTLTANEITASLEKEAALASKLNAAKWDNEHPAIIDHTADRTSLAPVNAADVLPEIPDRLPEIPLDGYDAAIEKLTALRNVLDGMGGDVSASVDRWAGLAEIFNNEMATGAEKAGAALVVAGDSLKAFGANSAAAKVGAIAASIGQLILGFATASAAAAKGGPIVWLGFLISGLATVASVIGTIKGFAGGGIIDGNTFHGDAIVARVNAGEMILNRTQQSNLFRLLDSGGSRAAAPVQVRFVLEGDKLVGCVDTYKAKMGLA
jgi:hypothetical protein